MDFDKIMQIYPEMVAEETQWEDFSTLLTCTFSFDIEENISKMVQHMEQNLPDVKTLLRHGSKSCHKIDIKYYRYK